MHIWVLARFVGKSYEENQETENSSYDLPYNFENS
jgi:hypothetical protein